MCSKQVVGHTMHPNNFNTFCIRFNYDHVKFRAFKRTSNLCDEYIYTYEKVQKTMQNPNLKINHGPYLANPVLIYDPIIESTKEIHVFYMFTIFLLNKKNVI